LSIKRFRFHGIRKLNWAERAWIGDYDEHMRESGLDHWIEPGPLMVVIGPNGGGKTTVIDLFRALADASIWPSLPRENYGGGDFSGFDVEGASFALSARFSKYTPEASDTFEFFTATVIVAAAAGPVGRQLLIPKYARDGEWRTTLQALLDAQIALPICYRPATGGPPGEELNDSALVALLNELSAHFPSVMANPMVQPFKLFAGAAEGPGRIGVLFKEDAGQHTFVHRSLLPAGWLQLASVLAFARNCPNDALMLLDEPDRHLHPSLQRVMLEVIAKEGASRNAQIVLATHSSVLVNPELGSQFGIKVLTAARGRCEELTNSRRVLDDLGVTSSDLVQANGILWVEGPSDRIYLKTWLEAYARSRSEEPPIERVHYVIVSYGGALFKHLTLANESVDKLDLRNVNRNYFVVIDSDLPQFSEEPLSSEKSRLLAEARAIETDPSIWITRRYTIESYIPLSWPMRAKHLRETEEGRLRVVGTTKVELAERFRDAERDWSEYEPMASDLGGKIEKIFDAIRRWQSPQEDIEPRYLPPFLRSPDDAD